MSRSALNRSSAWLHTWGGLVFGWLLFAIFVTGTLALFDKEISHWMQPEVTEWPLDQPAALDVGLGYLQARHAGAASWQIRLPTERDPVLSVGAGEGGRGHRMHSESLDPLTHQPVVARETAGGGFFFRFHYMLHLPNRIGVWITGAAALMMLVALVSGIILHKRIFKDFFLFRPRKEKRSWLDAHLVSGVMILPFHLLISYTALVIFMFLYMPAADQSVTGGQALSMLRGAPPAGGEHKGPPPGRPGDSASRTLPGGAAPREPAVAAVPLTNLRSVLAYAEATMGPIAGLSIHHPGRADAQILVQPTQDTRIERSRMRGMLFDGVTGALLRPAAETGRGTVQTQQVLVGLHFAQFGGYGLRWLYFLCGVASCVMIATGLVLFTLKRRQADLDPASAEARMHRLAERLNVGAVAGLLLACSALLWANHLLPAALDGRTGWEATVFFGVWLLSLLHALWRPWQQAWVWQLGLTALLLLGLPLLNDLFCFEHHGGLETTAVVLGLLLAGAGWKIHQRAVIGPDRD